MILRVESKYGHRFSISHSLDVIQVILNIQNESKWFTEMQWWFQIYSIRSRVENSIKKYFKTCSSTEKQFDEVFRSILALLISISLQRLPH